MCLATTATLSPVTSWYEQQLANLSKCNVTDMEFAQKGICCLPSDFQLVFRQAFNEWSGKGLSLEERLAILAFSSAMSRLKLWKL